MFSIKDRDNLREYIINLAESDSRVVAGAVVGSFAINKEDRWSDLDLTFSVSDNYSIIEVLEDWSVKVLENFNAIKLFDVPKEATIFRVFLLPNCLQFDLSFTPASKFCASGPKFKLLFGEVIHSQSHKSPNIYDLFGEAIHHALRARIYIERRRFWQAEFWISATRNSALCIACISRNLQSDHARGYDDLPDEILEIFKRSFVSTLTSETLMQALTLIINILLNKLDEIQEYADLVRSQLLELTTDWNT